MPQPFIFKTASFFPKVVSFEESLGRRSRGGGCFSVWKECLELVLGFQDELRETIGSAFRVGHKGPPSTPPPTRTRGQDGPWGWARVVGWSNWQKQRTSMGFKKKKKELGEKGKGTPYQLDGSKGPRDWTYLSHLVTWNEPHCAPQTLPSSHTHKQADTKQELLGPCMYYVSDTILWALCMCCPFNLHDNPLR